MNSVATQSFLSPPKSLNMRTRGVEPSVEGGERRISSGSCFGSGALGKRDLSVSIGAFTLNSSADVNVPFFRARCIRAFRERINASRRCVYEVERVGTVARFKGIKPGKRIRCLLIRTTQDVFRIIYSIFSSEVAVIGI